MKPNAHDNIERLKDRLIACGNEKIYRRRLSPHVRGDRGHSHRIGASRANIDIESSRQERRQNERACRGGQRVT